LFSYARFEIVLNDKKALESISESVRIAILNLPTTIRLYFFLFFVNIRVIINFIVFLLFPILIALSVTYISSQVFLIITLIFVGCTFVFLIVVLWYLWWVMDIFKTAIWYFAYMEWKKTLSPQEEKNNKQEEETLSEQFFT
jgi:Na+-transporting methylmalonyl-CoA/oxaloacetate decarboxylase gamma subunit